MNDKLKNKNSRSKKTLFIFSIVILVFLIGFNALSSSVNLPLIKFESNSSDYDSNSDFNYSNNNTENSFNIDTKNDSNSDNKIDNNVNDLIQQYRIRVKSNVTINIRNASSINSQIVGKANSGDVYDVYESLYSDGYTWQRIGIDMWIADDGTWTEQVSNDYVEQKVTFTNTNIGASVYFGKYEQNNNFSDGNEAIEWIVLDNDGSKILLLSKYALDSRIYNNSFTNWENSSIREWLNNYFFNNAFTDPERCYIENVTNTTEYNNESPTKDNVFLLSATEVEKYFPNDYDRICYATQYSFASGTENFSGKCRWWLRSLNGDEKMALTVRTREGRINYVTPVDSSGYGVRPAIWVSINKTSNTNVMNTTTSRNLSNNGGNTVDFSIIVKHNDEFNYDYPAITSNNRNWINNIYKIVEYRDGNEMGSAEFGDNPFAWDQDNSGDVSWGSIMSSFDNCNNCKIVVMSHGYENQEKQIYR